ncbi:hypothetical protein, partial [Serratia marcescens]
LSKKPTQVGFLHLPFMRASFLSMTKLIPTSPCSNARVFCVSKDGHFVSAGKRVGFQRQRHPALSSG